MKKTYYLIVKILLIIVIFVMIILLKIYHKDQDDLFVSNLFNTDLICARSAVVMEASTGRLLFEKNANLRLLTASIAKILSCIVAIENIDIERYVIIDEIVLQATGSSIYLKIGDVFQIKDLLYGMMLQSGNDASLVVAKSYSGNIQDFIIKMNELVTKIGMLNSSFENPTGLDETSKNYSSAYDMSLLMAYAMRNKTFRTIVSSKTYRFQNVDNKYYAFQNKHRMVREDSDVIGGKTGYTKKAGRTLVTYFKQNHMELIVVTFDAANDWKLHRDLANKAYEQYEMHLLLTPFTFQMSTLLLPYKLKLKRSVYYPLKKEEKVDIMITYNNEDCYLKVLKKGQLITKFILELTKG